MDIKIRENYIKYQRIINTVMLFVVSVVFLMGFLDNSLFPSDEEEIFVKGMAMARGQFLYKDIVSQHMPLMYYFAAFFYAIGVHSIVGFRFSFYILMALMFAIIQCRYGKLFSYKLIWIYAVGYLAFSAYISQGTTILSEQIQQFGIIILLLEFYLFIKTNKIGLWNSVFISFAIVLSFGSAFVSVFQIAVIFFAVVVYFLKLYKKNDKHFRKRLLKESLRLIVIILLPWICYFLYLLITNTWEDFFYWNYTFNREVYPKYLEETGEGSYGTSVIGTYLFGVKNWFSVWLYKGSILNILNLSTILGAFVLLFIAQRIKKGQNFEAVTTLFYIFACSTRAVFEFHGLPCIAVECLLMAYCINELIGDKKLKAFLYDLKESKMLVCLAVICVVLAGMLSQIGDIFNEEPINQLNDDNSMASIVQKLTFDDEKIGFVGLNYDVLVESNRVMLNKNPATPWFWEGCKEDIMDVLQQEKPRVIVYYRDIEVWGYELKGFARELDEFITEEYTPMNAVKQNYIYVRDDYYEEALDILGVSVLLFDMSNEKASVTSLLHDGDEIVIRCMPVACEIDSFSIQFGTYQKDRVADFDYEIVSVDDGKIIKSGTIDGESIFDNEYTEVKLESPVLCESGKEYELKLTVSCQEGEEISIYTNQGNNKIKCYINEEFIVNDINVLFYGKYKE